MNTKGSKQVAGQREIGKLNKLMVLIENAREEDAALVLRVLTTKRAEREELEEACYPPEFLEMMEETGFQTLREYLESHDAPKAMVGLLDDLIVLNMWTKEVEKLGGLVSPSVNRGLDVVQSLSRHVAEAGGTFYAPMGQVFRREGLKVEDILND